MLNALIDLAQDLALKVDTDPDHIVSKALLRSSLCINVVGFPIVEGQLSRDYSWFLEMLEVKSDLIG